MISREARDVVHAELMVALADIGGIYEAVERGDFAEAWELRQRYDDVLRLLDDLGWGRDDSGDPDSPGREFAITMAPDALARLLHHLSHNATDALTRRIAAEDAQARETSSFHLKRIAVFGAILTQVAEREPGARS